MKLSYSIFFCLLTYTGYLCAQEVLLYIDGGKIKGTLETTATNVSYFSFKGIPYAQPPLGSLRYQAPKPVEPWNGTLDATYEKSICYQVMLDSSDENEDCLYLNVFAPKDAAYAEPLPVIVYVYGGGFFQGSSRTDNHGPQFLMEYSVILVTFNYKLGPFGFFSTGDSAIPGNAGLKDQNLALRWVQKNIEYFGGDKDKVTIYGESAGASSVGYHILSPKSKGLFRAAICSSASVLTPFAYQRYPVYYTYKTAGIINAIFESSNMSSTQLRDFATYISPRVIDRASHTLFESETPDYIQAVQGFFYAPVIEHEHDEAFITEKMYESLKNGNFTAVPLIIGMNSRDLLKKYAVGDLLNLIGQTYDQNLALLLPMDMNIRDEDTALKAAMEVKSFYSPNATFEENHEKLSDCLMDLGMTRGMRKYAELQSNVSDVYFYQFSYAGILGGQRNESVDGFSEFVLHGENLGYIFTHNLTEYNTSDLSQFPKSDVLVHKRLITMFTNFVKSLNPTPEESDLLENIIWPTVNTSTFVYLAIGSSSQVRINLKEDAYRMWETLYDNYGNPPYDTY